MSNKLDTSGSIYYASNVNEAVRVAKKLRQEGSYDLFRGQIRNFPVQPGLFRVGVDRIDSINRLNQFADWVHQIPELQSLHSDKDAILAVAQHYGIRTTLLDFTASPEMAGFFATDGEPPPVKNEEFSLSCIICANRLRLEESWSDINARARQQLGNDLVRVIEIDVKNLWRLQAQKGLFIDVRVEPNLLEMFSFFFRILFPFNEPLKNIRRTSVYPENKSHLEILLEQYFYRENFTAALLRLNELLGPPIYAPKKPFRGKEAAFINNTLPPSHHSWNSKMLGGWKVEPHESFNTAVSSKSIRLRFRAEEDPAILASRIRKQILRAIERSTDLREYSIKWEVIDVRGEVFRVDDEATNLLEDDTLPKIAASNLVSLIWDGMRRLPFSDEQIASGIGNYLALAKYDHAAKQLYGRTCGIELSSAGARTRAFASEQGIIRCIRDDMFEFITLDQRETIQESRFGIAYEFMAILIDPSRLFEFTNLVDLFAKEIIPSQVLIRLEGDMILFSPAQLDILGND